MTTFPIHRAEDPDAFFEALRSIRPGDTVSIALRHRFAATAKPATVTGEVWQGDSGRLMVGYTDLKSSPSVQSILSIEKPTLTVEDLAAMSPGSFVIDKDRDVWVKHPSGLWLTENEGPLRATQLAHYNPRPYTPTQDPK